MYFHKIQSLYQQTKNFNKIVQSLFFVGYVKYEENIPTILIGSPFKGDFKIELKHREHSNFWNYQMPKNDIYSTHWVTPSNYPTEYEKEHITTRLYQNDKFVAEQVGESSIGFGFGQLQPYFSILTKQDLVNWEGCNRLVDQYRHGVLLDFDLYESEFPQWENLLSLIRQSGGTFEQSHTASSTYWGSGMGILEIYTLTKYISEKKYNNIMEFGTWRTGTAHLLSTICKEVISIDILKPRPQDLERWRSIVNPIGNLQFIEADINKKGEQLILEYAPDLLIIDYEHKSTSTVHFANFAIEQGIDVIIHDVNEIYDEADATFKLVEEHFDDCSFIKTPYMSGVLLIMPKKKHRYSISTDDNKATIHFPQSGNYQIDIKNIQTGAIDKLPITIPGIET